MGCSFPAANPFGAVCYIDTEGFCVHAVENDDAAGISEMRAIGKSCATGQRGRLPDTVSANLRSRPGRSFAGYGIDESAQQAGAGRLSDTVSANLHERFAVARTDFA